MIAMLRGKLVRHASGRGVLDVAGVGYEVFATRGALERWTASAEPVTVEVSTQVREDAIALYGFESDRERLGFLALLQVAGVGPKVALATLDALGVDGLCAAVDGDDLRALSAVPGVGKKTAQRLALELKGKLPAGEFKPVARAAASAPDDPLPLALARLGYTKSEIDKLLAALLDAGVAPEAEVGDRLRRALQLASGDKRAR